MGEFSSPMRSFSRRRIISLPKQTFRSPVNVNLVEIDSFIRFSFGWFRIELLLLFFLKTKFSMTLSFSSWTVQMTWEVWSLFSQFLDQHLFQVSDKNRSKKLPSIKFERLFISFLIMRILFSKTSIENWIESSDIQINVDDSFKQFEPLKDL